MQNTNLKELFFLLVDKTKLKAELELKAENLQISLNAFPSSIYQSFKKQQNQIEDEIALTKKKIDDISETIKYVGFRMNEMDKLKEEYETNHNKLLNECIIALKEE